MTYGSEAEDRSRIGGSRSGGNHRCHGAGGIASSGVDNGHHHDDVSTEHNDDHGSAGDDDHGSAGDDDHYCASGDDDDYCASGNDDDYCAAEHNDDYCAAGDDDDYESTIDKYDGAEWHYDHDGAQGHHEHNFPARGDVGGWRRWFGIAAATADCHWSDISHGAVERIALRSRHNRSTHRGSRVGRHRAGWPRERAGSLGQAAPCD